jgi:hypothetical protein
MTITVEKWRALKYAMRYVQHKQRMEVLSAPPDAPDYAAVQAWQEALRRDEATDPYHAGPVGDVGRRPRPRGADLAGTGN